MKKHLFCMPMHCYISIFSFTFSGCYLLMYISGEFGNLMLSCGIFHLLERMDF